MCFCKVVLTVVNLYERVSACMHEHVHVLACMCVKCSLLWTCTLGLSQSIQVRSRSTWEGGGLATASLLSPGRCRPLVRRALVQRELRTGSSHRGEQRAGGGNKALGVCPGHLRAGLEATLFHYSFPESCEVFMKTLILQIGAGG